MDKETIQLIASISSLGTILVMIVLSIFKPNAKQDIDIGKMEVRCTEKHKNIDKDIFSINNEITLIKENHLKHIEQSISDIKNEQATIRTILDERLPKKQ